MECTPERGRIISARFYSQNRKLTLINVYLLTNDASMENKDDFLRTTKEFDEEVQQKFLLSLETSMLMWGKKQLKKERCSQLSLIQYSLLLNVSRQSLSVSAVPNFHSNTNRYVDLLFCPFMLLRFIKRVPFLHKLQQYVLQQPLSFLEKIT